MIPVRHCDLVNFLCMINPFIKNVHCVTFGWRRSGRQNWSKVAVRLRSERAGVDIAVSEDWGDLDQSYDESYTTVTITSDFMGMDNSETPNS